jgi:hypothetical protein
MATVVELGPRCGREGRFLSRALCPGFTLGVCEGTP